MGELRAKFAEVFGDRTLSGNRDWLIRRILWGLQELVEGGLSERARRRAEADAHHERTGTWPGVRSGPITDAPGEIWSAIDNALAQGNRGLPGGDTLFRMLKQNRKTAGNARSAD